MKKYKIIKLPPNYIGKIKYRKPKDVPFDLIPDGYLYKEDDDGFYAQKEVYKLSNRYELYESGHREDIKK